MIELHRQWMEEVKDMPEDVPYDAHTRQLLEHQSDLEQIAAISLPAPSRGLQMLNTTPLEEQEQRRVDVDRIAL